MTFQISHAIIGMLSSAAFKPYLIRTFHEYLTAIGETPYITVDCSVAGVDVPTQWINDNKIILNLSYSATVSLFIGDGEIKFGARFGSNQRQIAVPMEAVLVIYSRETNFQIPFIRVYHDEAQIATAKEPHTPTEVKAAAKVNYPATPAIKRDRSHLTIIK